MVFGAWLCLLAPLGGAIAITLAGQLISRRIAGYISTLTTFLAFGGALIAFFGLWGQDAAEREELSTAYTWLAAGDFEVGMEILVDPLSTVMMLVVSGVGALIVCWHHRPEAVAAAKKAFVMNAIGDGTFALGAVLLVWQTGTLELLGVFDEVEGLSSTIVNLVALGLLGGAVAKSAQVPLHTWLP